MDGLRASDDILIGRDDWGRISRLAAFELSNESQQAVSDATLKNKYQSL